MTFDRQTVGNLGYRYTGMIPMYFYMYAHILQPGHIHFYLQTQLFVQCKFCQNIKLCMKLINRSVILNLTQIFPAINIIELL